MIPGDIQSLAPDVKGGYSCKGLLNDRLCSSLNECQAAIILHNFCTFFESAPCNTSDTLCLYVRSAGRLLLDPTLSASSKWRALSGWRWIVEILLRVILLFACGLIWPFTTAQASAVLQIDKLWQSDKLKHSTVSEPLIWRVLLAFSSLHDIWWNQHPFSSSFLRTKLSFFVWEDSEVPFAGLRFGLVPTLQCRVTQSTGTLIQCSCWEKVVKTIFPWIICIGVCFYMKVTMWQVIEDVGWHKLMEPC